MRTTLKQTRLNNLTRQLLPFSSLVFIIALWTFLEPHRFLDWQNWENVLRRSSINGIMAAGMTFIIITAGIDLSVGSMLAFCGMIGSMVMLMVAGADWSAITGGTYVPLTGVSIFAGILAAIGTGALCGLANGVLITRLRLAPFIVTLGTMSIFRGASYLANDGKPFAVADFTWLDTGSILGLPSSVVLLAVVFAVAALVLNRTPFGRHTYAIGSNVDTAYHAGVNVSRALIAIYALTGALVGLAAMITTSRASSAQPSAGLALELDIIAAVIIGGCSPTGGRGTIVGTIIGTLLISFLRNGLTLLGITTNVQLVVIGMIIILAVAVDQMATQRKG